MGKYNGWTNYETWNWNNHLMCEDERIDYLRANNNFLKTCTEEELKTFLIDMLDTETVDGDSIHEVNLEELRNSIIDI